MAARPEEAAKGNEGEEAVSTCCQNAYGDAALPPAKRFFE
jgi:hypothetical protein